MKEAIFLTELDREDLLILMELQGDGRMSYADISRRTGIPSSTIHDRVKRLVSSGVITKFAALIDEERVGVGYTAIIGVETGARLYRQVAEELCGIEEVVEVYGSTAEFDLMIKVRASSRKELSQHLSEIRVIEGIDDIYVMSILEVFKEEHTLPLRHLVEE